MVNPEYIYCTICGMTLGDDDCIVYYGPHWPHMECPSLNISDQAITRFKAMAESQYGKAILSTGKVTYPPEVYHRYEGNDDGAPQDKMYIAIHPACEEMAGRVMKSSPNARIRSTGDLWLVLERRCASYLHWQRQRSRQRPRVLLGRDEGFVPDIINPETGDRSFDGYYVPLFCLLHTGDEWEGWWDENPVDIPNLTTDLMSNLERVEPAPDSKVKKLLESLPNEIKNHICSFLQDGELSLDCNYLMPQSMWAGMFFRIAFLWDLDTKAVYEKTGSSTDDLDKWNWEMLTRKVISRVESSLDVKPWDDEEDAWDYSKVGLNVAGGFANRRRIWQMLEEMRANAEDGDLPEEPIEHYVVSSSES
ncbi:hypothetical protein ACHAP4_010638 [Fusarium culmorum]